MYTVGLTGGIGSGKTVVGKIFSTLGIAIFNADSEAKKLYDTDETLRAKLIDLLGDSIYKGPQLQRKEMAAIIFSTPELLQKVNELVHPLLGEYFLRFAAQQQSPYVMMEAAILFESGLGCQLQKTITVTASETVRLQRVMQRDSVSETDVRQRMRHQWPDERRNAMVDFVITNDEKSAVLPQVINIHTKIMNFLSHN